MDAYDFVFQSERDAIVVAAIRHALTAMEATDGHIVRMEGVRGMLHFEPQIQKLKMALHLLGVTANDHAEALIRE
ncbi:MAG: hypothetical protein V4693_08360 [Pseudomonadota bacterium]